MASDSIILHIHSRSLSQSLKESFSVVKSYPGATTQDMVDYIKVKLVLKPVNVILDVGTNNQRSDQTPSDISVYQEKLAIYQGKIKW